MPTRMIQSAAGGQQNVTFIISLFLFSFYSLHAHLLQVGSFSPRAQRRRSWMVSTKENPWSRAWRAAKTLFFIANMLASLLVSSATPLLVVLLDLLLPTAILSAADGPESSVSSLTSQLETFRFRASLVDLPLVSITRSLIILCTYFCCNGLEPYLGVTSVCAASSAGYVSIKAFSMFWADHQGKWRLLPFGDKEVSSVDALFFSSLALALAHVVAAYRTSCRERRKLLVYKIDVEAALLCNKDFPKYHKIALSE